MFVCVCDSPVEAQLVGDSGSKSLRGRGGAGAAAEDPVVDRSKRVRHSVSNVGARTHTSSWQLLAT